MNIPEIELPRIVIIGCGFAGLKLTKTLNDKVFQIVLLDKNNYHTFQPLMYQVASSGLEPDSIVYPIRKIFKGKKNFHFRMASVNNINDEQKEIHTDIGALRYDYLVIATGATSNFFGLKNIEKHAFTMKSLVDSLDLRSIILQNFEKALNTSDLKERESYMNFVIVGAGATGVELAGALAELKKYVLPKDYPDLDIRLMQIHVIEAADRVLANMSEKASTKSIKFLKDLGINVWLNTMVKDYDGSIVSTSVNNITTKTLIWSAGVKGTSIPGLEAKQTKSSRIVVDDKNKVLNHDAIFAIGDIASIESEQNGIGHAMLASVAGQQGKHLGKNFNALAKNLEMKPFQYKDKGTMATIGRFRAVVDLSFAKFGGVFAWFIWMFLHLMLLIDFRNRLIIFANWSWSFFNYDKGIRLITRNVKRIDD
ncbi:NAD(P)/FAD-dependent oxidoreductase [Flavobacteriaceae bacterium AU392]|nr:NAD(P)/FAD-dependent oxidoreductase [Flavobacteriaceae bacterium]RKM86145.1 NAD(P)/FAD-dependent oxidoreductase [Flavobacteriaceae bacterium AU392]